jgi:NAD+ kinase
LRTELQAEQAAAEGAQTARTGSAERRDVLFIYNARLSRAEPLARALVEVARGEGALAQCANTFERDVVSQEIEKADLVVALGGDGTILRAARLAVDSGAPVLGVNLGELGFLAELQPEDAPAVLPQILAGAGWVEERLGLEALATSSDGVPHGEPILGLNDVFVGRGEYARVVHIRIAIDDVAFTSIVGDGLIVATPTGSTAYNHAARGPILDPRLRSLVLTPVSPYLTFSSPVVLAPDSRIELEVVTDWTATLTVDGQSDVLLRSGWRVRIVPSRRPARFLRLRPPGEFYATLQRRLRPDHFWDERARQ